jgi:D-glycerate 3-kinase
VKLDEFIRRERLPMEFADTARTFYLPLAAWLDGKLGAPTDRAFVLGINGAQGTGKSTLSAFLADCLYRDYGRRVATLSIDDLYLTREERRSLAENTHPLLETRGVPGTHDVELGISVIERLATLGRDDTMSIPRFDKARDDRAPESAWPAVNGPIDLVIFEGWCVGSLPEPDAALKEPVNALERREDADGRWRRYVNEQLKTVYPPLFALLDTLVFLGAPGFDAIREWRLEQEHKLRDSSAPDAGAVMSDAEIVRFIGFFERVTRHSLETLPGVADVILRLDHDHRVTGSTLE